MSWHAVDPVDESFFTTAPLRYQYPIELPVAPERVWESLTSERSVAAWGPGVHRLTWLTPRPFGVGTRREVVMPFGSITVRERFFVWQDWHRYAFHADEANRPLFRHFAEDFVVQERPGGSRLTWTVALQPLPRTDRLLHLGSPLTRLAFGQLASSAKRYFAAHP